MNAGRMHGFRGLRWLVLALAIGATLVHPLARTVPAQTAGVETWTDAQIEEFLSKAKIVRTKGTRRGSRTRFAPPFPTASSNTTRIFNKSTNGSSPGLLHKARS